MGNPAAANAVANGYSRPEIQMSKLLRGLAAGYGARKLTGGCGCMGIIVFIILWMILGNFGIFQ